MKNKFNVLFSLEFTGNVFRLCSLSQQEPDKGDDALMLAALNKFIHAFCSSLLVYICASCRLQPCGTRLGFFDLTISGMPPKNTQNVKKALNLLRNVTHQNKMTQLVLYSFCSLKNRCTGALWSADQHSNTLSAISVFEPKAPQVVEI